MRIDNIGNLMYLYMKEISPGEGTDATEFLIKATAKTLNRFGGQNWIPVIVKETGEDQYQVISNSFIYAVAKEAGLEKIWCIIADDSQETAELAKVLSGEIEPKINLTYATRDEIRLALQYLIEKPGSAIRGVNISVATNRIEEAPDRKYWKTFEPINKLRCGITTGAKLNAIKEVFYLTPELHSKVQELKPDIASELFYHDTKDPDILKKYTVAKLKEIAKKREIPGYTRKRKDELIKILSQ